MSEAVESTVTEDRLHALNPSQLSWPPPHCSDLALAESGCSADTCARTKKTRWNQLNADFRWRTNDAFNVRIFQLSHKACLQTQNVGHVGMCVSVCIQTYHIHGFKCNEVFFASFRGFDLKTNWKDESYSWENKIPSRTSTKYRNVRGRTRVSEIKKCQKLHGRSLDWHKLWIGHRVFRRGKGAEYTVQIHPSMTRALSPLTIANLGPLHLRMIFPPILGLAGSKLRPLRQPSDDTHMY